MAQAYKLMHYNEINPHGHPISQDMIDLPKSEKVLVTKLFYFLKEIGLGTGIYRGMALTPYPS